MNIGALIIGDELLSGKRQDKHFNHLQQVLAAHGLELSWTMIVGDDPLQLKRFLSFTMASDDLVFCFGGIGATPDDRTRQTAADVANVALSRHPEAVCEIEAQFGDDAYPKRILMAELPEGSSLIPNPINRVPGFSLKHHHFMPGFPEMSWPMIDWLLENKYPNLRNLAPAHELCIHITHCRESDLLDVMTATVKQHPNVQLSSLPRRGHSPSIELSLRGELLETTQAMAELKQTLTTLKVTWLDHVSQ
jgi:molybdopterin-biosynthesis enzyme MoeA-like protein